MLLPGVLLAMMVVPPPAVVAPSRVIVSPPIARLASSTPAVTEVIDVQIRQDGVLLWSGSLMRASDGSASYVQQLMESRTCSDAAATDRMLGATANTRQSRVSITLNAGYPRMDGTIQLTLERTRPLDTGTANCGGRDATSAVTLQTRVDLPQGKAVTVNGEAGLSVTLKRR